MFYIFKDNVFLIDGHVKSCIYDLNQSKLYHINNTLAEKLKQAINGLITTNSTDDELKKAFNYLLNKDILLLSDKPETNNFQDIYYTRNNCHFAWIEITEKCNLKCRHCYNESDEQKKISLTISDFKFVIDNLLKLGIKKIQIIGGEPFIIGQKLKEMIDYTTGKFEVVEIFTNGTLITKEWLNYLKQSGLKIALSVYSYDCIIHDKVTNCKGSWEKTNQTIEMLNEYNIPYRVCNVLMRDIELGKPTTKLYTLSEKKDIVRMSGRADFSLLSDELIKKKLITKRTFSHPLNKNFVCMSACEHNCFSSKIYISARLDVYPCVMERRIKHCKINKTDGITLKDSIRKMNKDYIKECCLCEYRYTCFDCRPNSLSSDLYEKPWYCTYKPLLGTWENEDEFIRKLKDKWS